MAGSAADGKFTQEGIQNEVARIDKLRKKVILLLIVGLVTAAASTVIALLFVLPNGGASILCCIPISLNALILAFFAAKWLRELIDREDMLKAS